MMRAVPLAAAAAWALAGAVPAGAIDLRPSKAEQIRLGREAAAQVRREAEVLPATDPRVILLREVGARLVAQIPEAERRRTGFQYTFDLVRDPEVNAFALPGGPTFFYTGLFSKFETVDQLAAVMAHEITHVREEHWATAYADNLKRRLGLAILFSALDVRGTTADILSIGDTIAFTLPYSRRHETRADDGGYDLMVRAGFNPVGMPQMFRKLGDSKGGWLGDKLSTHPDTRARIQRAERRVAEEKRTFAAPVPMPDDVRAANEAEAKQPPAKPRR